MKRYVTEPRRRITRGPRKAKSALRGGASRVGFSAAFLEKLLLAGMLLALALCVVFLFPTAARAADSTVTVDPTDTAPANVYPGKKNDFIRFDLTTNLGTAEWTGIWVDIQGTADDTDIAKVVIYKSADTTWSLTDTAIGEGAVAGGVANITLTAPQTVSTTAARHYFVVFDIAGTAKSGLKVGARLVLPGSTSFNITGPDIMGDTNLPFTSLMATFVGEPHGSPGNTGAYVNTNYCPVCHNVHMAEQNRRILSKLYTSDPSVVNNNSADVYSALCFSCHDGTGASMDIRSNYSGSGTSRQAGAGDDLGPVISPGHMTDQTGTIAAGYLQGNQYDSGVKLPCMVCHDVHQSRNGNYSLMADGLYEFASTTTETTDTTTASFWWESSSTVWESSATDNYNRRKRCEVCHRNADGTSDTTGTSGTGSYADGKSVVVGIDLGLPSSHAVGNKASAWCGSCHGVHKISIEKPGNFSESAGNGPCKDCHQASIFSPMQETSTYHHYMQNTDVTKLPSSSTKYPTKDQFTSGDTTSSEKRCLMCHVDHDVFSPATGGIPANGNRGANLRTSIALIPTAVDTSSFSNTDFDAEQSEGGICVSCHSLSQTKNTTDQKFLSAEDATRTMVISKADFAEATSAHNYEATSSFPGRSWDATVNRPFEFRANCVKCHNTIDSGSYPFSAEADTGSKQDSTYRFQLHATEVRRLLSWLNIMPQDSAADPLEENFCNRCHGGSDNPNFAGGKDYYNRVTMAQTSLDVKSVILKSSNHPVGGSLAKHRAIEGMSSNWNPAGVNRHVECEDCHNSHAAKAIDENNPIRGGSEGAAISETEKGVWGVTPSGYTSYTTGTATFTEGSNSVVGSGTGWTSDTVAAGWYIKSTYDMDGQWYKVTSVDYGAQTLTLNQNFDGVRAYFDGNPNTARSVEYSAVKVTYSRIDKAAYEYEICLKCHSTYSYDDTAPDTPSNHAGGSVVKETDIGHDFNPEQMAIHPVTALGKNQPGRADQTEMNAATNAWPLYTEGTVTVTDGSTTVGGSNTSWLNMGGSGTSTIVPGWLIKFGADTTGGPFDTGWYQVKKLLSDTTITLTGTYEGTTGIGRNYKLGAGLGNTFVPPWGPWSRMTCSDCHGNDNDGGPRGPHGSAARWVLRETTTTLAFNWFDGTTVQALSPNDEKVGAGTAVTATSAVFCFNCHRRDVYGDIDMNRYVDADNSSTTLTPDALLARVNHNPSNRRRLYRSFRVNNWGIVCMNCHGGDSLGGLHGTTKFQGRDYNTGAVFDTAMQNSGIRMLNGSTVAGVRRGTVTTESMHWTKRKLNFPNSDEVITNGGGRNWGVLGDFANYDYDILDP